MHDPVDRRRCRHWVGEHLLPLGEDQVRGNAERAALVALRYRVNSTSARAPINMRILSFLMQFMGYRFHPQSLTNALSRDPNVANLGWQGYDVERSDAAAIALNLGLWFAPSMPAFHNLVERCRRDLVEGIKEYQRRTSRA